MGGLWGLRFFVASLMLKSISPVFHLTVLSAVMPNPSGPAALSAFRAQTAVFTSSSRGSWVRRRLSSRVMREGMLMVKELLREYRYSSCAARVRFALTAFIVSLFSGVGRTMHSSTCVSAPVFFNEFVKGRVVAPAVEVLRGDATEIAG
ncbi:unnamed protein product [Cuscuta campestris]|uniref:Secreted protein n=1 Tax=Cuscuta campestris TaxID=132261 RepID=A0A484KVM2_9ASTE|nr:unnamed protein product [Cuscuta campestris]